MLGRFGINWLRLVIDRRLLDYSPCGLVSGWKGGGASGCISEPEYRRHALAEEGLVSRRELTVRRDWVRGRSLGGQRENRGKTRGLGIGVAVVVDSVLDIPRFRHSTCLYFFGCLAPLIQHRIHPPALLDL